MPLPKFINSRSIAAWLGPTWRAQRIQRILRQMGIARVIGRAIVVTPEDLASYWPDVYELILEKIEEIPPLDHGLAGRRRTKLPNGRTVVSDRCKHEYAANLPGTQLTCTKCGAID